MPDNNDPLGIMAGLRKLTQSAGKADSTYQMGREGPASQAKAQKAAYNERAEQDAYQNLQDKAEADGTPFPSYDVWKEQKLRGK